MSHSTVCNTTVSTKKTHCTLVKQVHKLRVTPHACKGNAPVTVKKYVFVQAINRGHGYGCVSPSTKSPVDNYLCVCVYVCVMLALRDVIEDARPRCVCAFVHSYVRSRVGMGVCMCVRPASSLLSIATCVCMYMYVQ